METKDPALTKNRITDTDVDSLNTHDEVEHVSFSEANGNKARLSNTKVSNSNASMDPAVADDTLREDNLNSHHSDTADFEDSTSKENGTETLKEGIVGSEHVKEGDNPARQPDRRDQSGTGFDDNINEETVGSTAPKSDSITINNRYATIDNAQSRVFSPDEKD